MKKLIALLFVSVLVVSGCSSKAKDKTTVCKIETGGQEIAYEYTYGDDDKVKKLILSTTEENDKDITDEDLDMAKGVYDSMFKDIKGLSYEMTVDKKNKKKITIQLIIDTEKYDAEKDVTGIFNVVGEDDKDKKVIKGKSLTKYFKDLDAKCSEK